MADVPNLTHVAGVSATDSNDPVVTSENDSKIVAKALRALAAKLDLDATVTDTNYLAVIDAITL
jgi:hypothetical protein